MGAVEYVGRGGAVHYVGHAVLVMMVIKIFLVLDRKPSLRTAPVTRGRRTASTSGTWNKNSPTSLI